MNVGFGKSGVEDEKPVRLADLDKPERQKQILAFCVAPRTVAEVADLLNCNYNTAANYVRVLVAGKLLMRSVNKGKGWAYIVNLARVVL